MWPEAWSKVGKAAQNREKQEWKNEKPKLDSARRLRGIYLLDDEEFQETKKARGQVGSAYVTHHALQNGLKLDQSLNVMSF